MERRPRPHCVRDLAAQREAEVVVERDRAGVRRIGVQERRFAFGHDAVRHRARQRRAIASAAIVRMRAHAADLDEARQAQPLARHRRQAPAVANADEAPERVRPGAERAGPGQRRQRDHLRRVVFAQRLDRDARLAAAQAFRHHLHARRAHLQRDAGRRRGRRAFEQRHVVVRMRQRAERQHRFGGLVRRRRERAHVFAEPQRPRIARAGERRLRGSERVPDRTVERVRACGHLHSHSRSPLILHPAARGNVRWRMCGRAL